jgi:hypothetical protein
MSLPTPSATSDEFSGAPLECVSVKLQQDDARQLLANVPTITVARRMERVPLLSLPRAAIEQLHLVNDAWSGPQSRTAIIAKRTDWARASSETLHIRATREGPFDSDFAMAFPQLRSLEFFSLPRDVDMAAGCESWKSKRRHLVMGIALCNSRRPRSRS